MTRQEDLDLAEELGFDFCGFIFHPKSPRHIAPEKACALKTGNLQRVGIFVNQDVAEIISIMRTAKLDYIQLHGAHTPEHVRQIGADRVIRTLWPQKYYKAGALEQEAERYKCAFFLLDAGQAGGGSGQTLGWDKLSGLNLPAPWFVAGGLDAHNAADAAKTCNPWALDFNSGLEDSPGIKNHKKMLAAATAVRHGIKS